jgi:hypothetical protein
MTAAARCRLEKQRIKVNIELVRQPGRLFHKTEKETP